MADTEMIPDKSLRAFNALCLHDAYLHQNKKLQAKIIDWAEAMLNTARQEWCDMRNDIIEVVIKEDRKAEALRKAAIKDEKYAPFRKYFKQIQKEKFDEAFKNGFSLTANSFVLCFLANKTGEIQIPYTKQNTENKLKQLAQKNNREFKKLLHAKA